jgi:hypothetical protein
MWVMRPSRMCRMRSAICAASGLWVIISTVWFSSRLLACSILQHGLRVFGVEIAGGLVSQQDSRARNQRARDSHTLLFAAGELIRPVVQPALNLEQLGEVVQQVLVQPLWGDAAPFCAISCASSIFDPRADRSAEG